MAVSQVDNYSFAKVPLNAVVSHLLLLAIGAQFVPAQQAGCQLAFRLAAILTGPGLPAQTVKILGECQQVQNQLIFL